MPTAQPAAARTVTLPAAGEVSVARTIDCIGAACPRPQLLTVRAFGQLQEGEVVELLSDSATSVESMPALMLVLHSTHIGTVRDGGIWRVYMRKGFDEQPGDSS